MRLGLACLALFGPSTALAQEAADAAPAEPEPSPEAVAKCAVYARAKGREARRMHPGISRRDIAATMQVERQECLVKERIRESYESIVVAESPHEAATEARATSEVTRREMGERMPRSSPDALRYEPGVYVQQTAHSQGSAYVRGVTGQQTVLLFDGVRMNNSTYRQGPNQYFFTVDSRAVSSIEVVRGSASVLYGSDAIGGALAAHPIEPAMQETVDGIRLTPRTMVRHATADDEIGGRFELDGQIGDRIGFVGGVGYRTVGQLEAAGRIVDESPYVGSAGPRPLVPEFAADGRTQLGTGFDEATYDGRLVYQFNGESRAVLALYRYLMTDAPRTDQCPPPYAPLGDCLTYEEQYRTLSTLALEGPFGGVAAQSRLVVSYQRQHERRRLDRPEGIFSKAYGRDDVDTVGISLQATSWPRLIGTRARVRVLYGADAYQDTVESVAWHILDTERNYILEYDSRGQYLDGSTYFSTGAFAQPELTLWERLTLRVGGRVSSVSAHAPDDPDSGSLAVDQDWNAAVGRVGAAYEALPGWTLVTNVDQGFRAPNLNDMTSRQQTGPGFQFENPDLEPERSLTTEVGSLLSVGRIELGAWGYRTTIDGAMARRLASADECPNLDCRGSTFRYKLVNLPGQAEIRGYEGTALARLPGGVRLRATIAYAIGDGQNPAERPEDPAEAAEYEERVPLSRIPPLNGTVEAVWRSQLGVFAGTGLRWARKQDRLAPQDIGDSRIPGSGTPGFVVVDLRAGYRLERQLAVGIVFENVFDEIYRYHGSAVNGAGRGLVLSAEVGL